MWTTQAAEFDLIDCVAIVSWIAINNGVSFLYKKSIPDSSTIGDLVNTAQRFRV